MGLWWMPPSGNLALTVELPDDWGSDEIEDQDQLISLVAMTLQTLIEEADEAEETLRMMVRDLENASMVGFGTIDMEALCRGEFGEVWSLLDSTPEMREHLTRLIEGKDRKEVTWPQKATLREPDNGADEMTLAEWTYAVTAGMYVPEWG